VDGIVIPAQYDIIKTDIDVGGEDFAGTSSDIDSLYWGVAADWYTVGMTVIAPPINTLGDGTSPFPAPTTVRLGISQGGNDLYSINALMFNGQVLSVLMWDLTPVNPAPITLDASTLKYEVNTGLELAVKASKFSNLSPLSPFDFDLHFEGGGENEDDRVQGTIPEPTTMSMLLIGGLAALSRRRRKR